MPFALCLLPLVLGAPEETLPTEVGTPIVRVGEISPTRTRDADCGWATPPSPDFFYVTSAPLRAVELHVLGQGPRPVLKIVGPLAPDTAKGPVTCGEGARLTTLAKMDGRYAVFVGTSNADIKSYTVMLLTKTTPRDPEFALPVRGELSVEQRELRWWLPFFDGDTPDLFLRAPPQLFVYANKTLTISDTRLPDRAGGRFAYPQAGEALLVERISSAEAGVLTADGELFFVSPKLLAAKAPAKPWLPSEPREKELDAKMSKGRLARLKDIKARFAGDPFWKP